jgi:hypothetical protein
MRIYVSYAARFLLLNVEAMTQEILDGIILFDYYIYIYIHMHATFFCFLFGV